MAIMDLFFPPKPVTRPVPAPVPKPVPATTERKSRS